MAWSNSPYEKNKFIASISEANNKKHSSESVSQSDSFKKNKDEYDSNQAHNDSRSITEVNALNDLEHEKTQNIAKSNPEAAKSEKRGFWTILFEKMISETDVKPKFIAAWLVGDIFAFIKENNLEVSSLNEKTKEITDLLKLVSDDVISNKAGKEILPRVLNGQGKPSDIVKELGLEQVSDSGELEKIIDDSAEEAA